MSTSTTPDTTTGTTRPARTSATSATAAVVRTEAVLFGRELGSLFWILLFPTILLVIIGLVPDYGEPDPALGGQRVIDLYASVCVVLAMIMAAIMAMPSVITAYREGGVLRRLRTTPVHPGALLGAQIGLHAGAVLVAVVLALGAARVVHDVPLPQAPGWYVVALLLAIAASFSIGAVVTAVSRSTRVAQTLGTVVLFPMMFTAGVWLPVQSMGGWLRDLVVATPLGAASEVLNDALQGLAPDVADLAVVGGWTVVLSLVAVRLFRWE
ncbi:ABC transporter permease [Nocardioides sp. zg-1228]|uniref:ABC transporter permease n=1 Tax=Nocardioides sp. zg-1228 TaxID=2763008 RepID=UPI0016430DC1|nr:ABC transporter permease [Nocardioides sp. zg-1228]MBC2933139.1 ABC transporter permease [Nocardioides sp. zg-1228]QSF56678.1 ABC transporter permease [Nocardioides sp. zg-1228]